MTSADPAALPPAWDCGTLLAKAQRYAEEMLRHDRDDWRCAFWSTLTLELIARAALAKISPALLADCSSWHNLYHALGHTPTAPKFIPKSIPISDVLGRLREIFPAFDKELEAFCAVHIAKRNAELHSAETPFDHVKNSAWLPAFYRACEALLKCMDKSLGDLVGRMEAQVAGKLIAAAIDEAAKAVRGAIKTHETVWAQKDAKERARLIAQGAAWARRDVGHKVTCPACKSEALVAGEAIATPKKSIDGDMIIETQEFLPSRFQCVACGLKISGLSHLSASGLGDFYKRTTTYDAAEYYAPDEEEQYAGYDEDNNEPM